jgi:hypothetical protein
MDQRDSYVAHDEKPDQYASTGSSLHNGSLIGGAMLAYFVPSPDAQFERMARLAETLIEHLVSPEIERLRNLAIAAKGAVHCDDRDHFIAYGVPDNAATFPFGRNHKRLCERWRLNASAPMHLVG